MDISIGTKKCLEYMDNKPWRLSVEKTQVGLQPQKIPFKYLGKVLRNKIQEFFNRVITMREVVIPIQNEKTKEFFYVPNREFSEMVRLEGGLQFLNVTVTQNIGNVENNSYYTVKEYNFKKSYRNMRGNEKTILEGNRKDYMSAKGTMDKSLSIPIHKTEDKGEISTGKMLWYHGTKAEPILKVKDIDVKKCRKIGEFGQGVYYTNVKGLAKEYALNERGEQLSSSKVFYCNWFSEELDILYGDMQKSEKSFIRVLHGRPNKNGEISQIRVKVLPKADREWVETILRGWAGFKVENVEMVIGPLASKNLNDLVQRESPMVIEKNGDVQNISVVNVVEKLVRIAKPLKLGKVEPIQLCCYEQWVNDLFIEVDCKKPLDIH